MRACPKRKQAGHRKRISGLVIPTKVTNQHIPCNLISLGHFIKQPTRIIAVPAHDVTLSKRESDWCPSCRIEARTCFRKKSWCTTFREMRSFPSRLYRWRTSSEVPFWESDGSWWRRRWGRWREGKQGESRGSGGWIWWWWRGGRGEVEWSSDFPPYSHYGTCFTCQRNLPTLACKYKRRSLWQGGGAGDGPGDLCR